MGVVRQPKCVNALMYLSTLAIIVVVVAVVVVVVVGVVGVVGVVVTSTDLISSQYVVAILKLFLFDIRL